jgi:hypothetical protein
MATLKQIRQRIRAAKNIQQITKAMKLVAAARLKKATDRVLEARPYADKLKDIMTSMSASGTPPSSISATESGGAAPATAPPASNGGGPIAAAVDDAAAAASAGLPPLSEQAVPLMEGLLYRESTLVPMTAKMRYGVLYA